MMRNDPHPQTIQIYLPDGDPTGIRLAEITTSVIRAIEVPRALLNDFLKTDDSKQVALYCLVGEDDQTGQPKAYIGQTSALDIRLKQHNKDKDFWNKVFIFISITNNLTTTHALYLESLAIEKVKSAERYQLENGNSGAKPFAPKPLTAECNIFFELVSILSGTLGLNIFKPLISRSNTIDETKSHHYQCNRAGCQSSAKYTEEGMIVLRGSKIAENMTKSMPDHLAKKREELISDGTIQGYILTRDYLFTSPSAASAFCSGRSSNGWVDWKDQSGHTLGKNERDK